MVPLPTRDPAQRQIVLASSRWGWQILAEEYTTLVTMFLEGEHHV